MPKTAVYTAIFGGRDHYKEPPPGDYDTFLFTDRPTFKERGLAPIVIPPIVKGDPVRSARMLKTMPHLFLHGYETTVWMDGSLEVKPEVDLGILVGRLLSDHQIATFRHYERSCAYDEAKVCSDDLLDDQERIWIQMLKYREHGFPSRHGLALTQLVARRMNAEVSAFGAHWWNEIVGHSRRDQLSFNYCAWRHHLDVKYVPCDLGGNEFFTVHPHHR